MHSTLYLFVCVLLFVFGLVDGLMGLLIFSFCRCEGVAACSRTRRGGGRGMAPFIGSRGSFSFLIVVGNCDFDVD